MATAQHQFIMGLVIKQIKMHGYKIIALDGKYPGLLGEKVPLPPTIIRHRPDIVAINYEGNLCIGEAKTENDALSKRTQDQLTDFSAVKINDRECEVYIGLPESGKVAFERMLRKHGLNLCPNIHPLFIPNEIISK